MQPSVDASAYKSQQVEKSPLDLVFGHKKDLPLLPSQIQMPRSATSFNLAGKGQAAAPTNNPQRPPHKLNKIVEDESEESVATVITQVEGYTDRGHMEEVILRPKELIEREVVPLEDEGIQVEED
mmetsp:Transcript_375/g.322  ORF Transcript_375/g.322 Transcript_375/m.322 type:complete len:125 (-) Transcript_375:825-1199(-)